MNSLTPISSLAESIRPLAERLRTCSGEEHDQTIADIAVAMSTISRRSADLASFVERYRKVAALPRPVVQPVRLSNLVDRLRRLVDTTLSSKSITWRSRIDPPDLVVTTDPELLEQALINLLHNAIDAVDGLPAPHIALDCVAVGDAIAISISDNGTGIDPAVRDRLFMPFFTTKARGSGIGLCLVHGIVTGHGGRIEVSENHPNGAKFTVTLPPTSLS